MPDNETHVIVGAGLAGAKTAEALREHGFDGRIVLVGSEPELPYERPPLSKDYLRGESPREKARALPDDWYSEHGIDLRTGTTVERIDPAAEEVVLTSGDRVGYDRLLIATGAEPRHLSLPGSELEGVHYLRDFADADAIAARLERGGPVVVIGAGWIGSEVAASARQKGLEVTIVERADVPLEHVVGAEVGAIYAQVHRDQGVELLTGASLEAFEGDGRVERVRLDRDRSIAADFVVVGVGVVPRTGLAEQAGLSVDDGIVVDARLETSASGIFAAGDVANAFHPFYRRHLRVEHWANALNQPAVAAQAMLGKDASYDRLPYFFSDQYDVGMEYTGYATSWDEVVFRGDTDAREFIAFWLEDGRVVAGMNVNVWDVTDSIKELISSRQPVDVDRLRDPDTPLDAVLARLSSPGTHAMQRLAGDAGYAVRASRKRA
jgi:3-phenylpropionate/trans-cinnamate dioxygenase ferredoxin reductase subunit